MRAASLAPPEATPAVAARSVSAQFPQVAYCAALTGLALLVHGYHPYSEDAAIYVPAIKKLIDPSLYPRGAEFFLAHAHYSVMARIVALSIRLTHLPVDYAMLLWHVLTVVLILIASWRICDACFHDRRASILGTALLAGVLTVPIAGTSLLLADPYFTGRSLSTPALLFAIVAVLDHKLLRAALWVTFAFLTHPLMAVYGGVFVVTLFALEYRRHKLLWLLALSIAALSAGGIAYAMHHPVSDSYRAAILTRPYLLLCNWAWYEILGLVGPLVLFGWLIWSRRRSPAITLTNCAAAALLNGVFFLLVALATVGTPKLLSLARYQPLRSFHLLYLLLFLLPVNLGLQRVLGRKPLLLALSLLSIYGGMFVVARQTYPASSHIEWPGIQSNNPWRQAFDWVRSNSPKDAVFALNPGYMDEPLEDSLGFRAYAERASLADRCTDGGVAVVFPQLAARWFVQTNDTNKLGKIRNDAQATRLREDGATWIIVSARSETGLSCPFSNSAVAVCRLSPIAATVAVDGSGRPAVSQATVPLRPQAEGMSRR